MERQTVRHRLRCVTVCLCTWKDRDSEAQTEVCDCVLAYMERQTVTHRLRCVTVLLSMERQRQ